MLIVDYVPGAGSDGLCSNVVKLWEHTPEELMTLPMPDLALLVLADFQEGRWLPQPRY
jgi:hypothetical protein